MSLKFRPASGTGVLHLLAGQFLEISSYSIISLGA
jgi:hypothetical protein